MLERHRRSPDSRIILDNKSRYSLQSAASAMANHPQDHGWRSIYAGIAETLADNPRPVLSLVENIPGVSSLSPSYVITLLGISLQQAWELLERRESTGQRKIPGHQIVPLAVKFESQLSSMLAGRRNSFTGVRRFLVPQVLLARHFATQKLGAINLLDIGTGIGLLPRQLDSLTCFQRFAPDLTWRKQRITYSPVGLASRFGMDLSPQPDLDWVRKCYGPSPYYDRMFAEIQETLALPDVQNADFTLVDQDACDIPLLMDFIAAKKIRAVTAVYSLYQYNEDTRQDIESAILDCLPPGGIFINIEPDPTLGEPGCTVQVRLHGVRETLTVCRVSDGHFKGHVTPAADYERFWR